MRKWLSAALLFFLMVLSSVPGICNNVSFSLVSLEKAVTLSSGEVIPAGQEVVKIPFENPDEQSKVIPGKVVSMANAYLEGVLGKKEHMCACSPDWFGNVDPACDAMCFRWKISSNEFLRGNDGQDYYIVSVAILEKAAKGEARKFYFLATKDPVVPGAAPDASGKVFPAQKAEPGEYPRVTVEGYDVILTSLDVRDQRSLPPAEDFSDVRKHMRFGMLPMGAVSTFVDMTPNVDIGFQVDCKDVARADLFYGVTELALKDEAGEALTKKSGKGLLEGVLTVPFGLSPQYMSPLGEHIHPPVLYSSSFSTLAFPSGDLTRVASFSGTLLLYQDVQSQEIEITDFSGAAIQRNIGDFEVTIKPSVSDMDGAKSLEILCEAVDKAQPLHAFSDFDVRVTMQGPGEKTSGWGVGGGSSQSGRNIRKNFSFTVPAADAGKMKAKVVLINRLQPDKKVPFEIKLPEASRDR
jgi:hypothetical protein